MRSAHLRHDEILPAHAEQTVSELHIARRSSTKSAGFMNCCFGFQKSRCSSI